VNGRAIGAVAAGGVVGALGRFAVVAATDAAPWATFTVNAVGCLLIGAVAALVRPDGVARLFLGTGVLGGFTTFSAYALDALGLAARPLTALLHVAGTLAVALAAVRVGDRAGRAAAGRLGCRRPVVDR
jgi:CrcB protein